jgi:hypothetical protein
MKNETEIESFEKHERQLHVYFREISILSKKHPNDALNKFKLALINNTIRVLNSIVGNPLDGFELFDEDLLPSNSDVALILAQYVTAIYEYRAHNTEQDSFSRDYHWMVRGKKSTQTSAPVSFRYKE